VILLPKKLTIEQEAQAIANELLRRKCKRSCRQFIKQFVKIEDLDAPGIVLPFGLWPAQARALRTFLYKRLVLVLKARQLGLTWLALAYAAWRMVFNPGYRVVVISANEDKAKEMIRRLVFILDHLPIWMIQRKKGASPGFLGPVFEDMTLSITIYHRKGEPSILQGLPATPGAGRMFTANLIIIDEWAEQQFAKEIWTGAFPIVNRPTGGQVIGLSTMKIGTLFDELSRGAEDGTNDFTEVFLSRWADPRRDQEWFEATKRNLPNTWRSEYPETPEEARSVGEGAFFEEWQEGVHVPLGHWEPPRSPAWPIIGIYDPAYNQACFKWYTVSPGVPGFPRGWARCFREYAPVHVTAYDQAREILRLSCYRDGKTTTIKDPYCGEPIEVPGTPFVFRYIKGDTRAWNKDDSTGISTMEIFARYGLVMGQADKNIENGWMELHAWLKPVLSEDGSLTAKLTFSRDCGVSRRTYPACEQSKTNPETISDKTPHDAQDCDRYFVMSRVKAVDIKESKLSEIEEKFGADSAEAVIFRKHNKDPRKRGVSLAKLGM
jgi:hypothetical protein